MSLSHSNAGHVLESENVGDQDLPPRSSEDTVAFKGFSLQLLIITGLIMNIMNLLPLVKCFLAAHHLCKRHDLWAPIRLSFSVLFFVFPL